MNLSSVVIINVNVLRVSIKGSQMSVDENRQVSGNLRKTCHDGFNADFVVDGDPCIVNADCIETNSSCKNYVCTVSVATQTISSKNAAVQTTQSIESVNDNITTPAQLDKSSSFSNRRIRNYIKYNKLENSDATKFSSIDDGSTQCKSV